MAVAIEHATSDQYEDSLPALQLIAGLACILKPASSLLPALAVQAITGLSQVSYHSLFPFWPWHAYQKILSRLILNESKICMQLCWYAIWSRIPAASAYAHDVI